MIGIVSYGSYVPRKRKSVEEIATGYNADAEKIKTNLRVFEKSIPGPDEDAATMAVVAAKQAVSVIDTKKIGALYIGSESHPYAVKPTSTIVSSALGLQKNLMTADLEFACKGGTAALQVCYAMVKADLTDYALAIGSDTAQAAPGDILEYSASAGAAAFILGTSNVIATIDATLSVTTDTPDFWRRSTQKYPQHTGRFTGEPSYFAHTIEATELILAQTGLHPKDFAHVVFHQPNGKFPRAVAKMLGFSEKQLLTGLLVEHIGNTYSANSLLGLCAVLDNAEPGQKILVTSYGSGSGSDAFVITTVGKK